ncbi:hypothetical protein MOC93_21240 [Bacillus haynesii]|uniref:hypothetical protein n=1 Tax=Bacillus haynesii TaxID=1925021 RepID=UPI00227F4498|nr:hypothetical protein [Bacillus haynesii]MCY8439215.1 hypothetical protein [Bacillus haynesii]
MISNIIFFLLGSAYTYYLHRLSKNRYQLTFLRGVSESNPNLFYYYVWNSGTDSILREDIISPHKCLTIRADGEILFTNLDHKTSHLKSVFLYSDKDNIKVFFSQLRPNEGFVIQSYEDNSFSFSVDLQHRHRVDFIKKPEWIRQSGGNGILPLINQYLAFPFLIISALKTIQSFNYYFTGAKEYSLFFLILYSALTLIMVILLPKMVEGIKAPIIPKGLLLPSYREERKQ